MQKHTLMCMAPYAVGALSLGGLLSCSVGETPNGQWYQFDCPNVGLEETRHYCIKMNKQCQVPEADKYCAWNWFDDVSGEGDFPEAVGFKNDCKNVPGVENGENPAYMPGYVCDPDGSATAGGSTGGSASGGGSTGGQSSAGEPTTSMGSTTGSGSGNVLWLCAKNAHTKCADLVPDEALGDDVPSDPARDECWGALSEDPNVYLAPCVEAPPGEVPMAQDNARMKCQMLCSARMEDIHLKMGNVCGVFDNDCYINKAIDCAINGQIDGVPESWDNPAELSKSPGWACEGGKAMMPVYLGQSEFVVFHGYGTVITPEGVSAGVSNVTGAIAYELSACTSAECTITIDAIQGFTYTAEGGYVDAAGGGGTFKLEQMGFQSGSIISGTWHKQRGNISFPDAVLDAQFWVGPVTVDGVPITTHLESYSIPVDQMVGSLRNESNPLTLNLAYNTDFGTVTVSLQTIPRN